MDYNQQYMQIYPLGKRDVKNIRHPREMRAYVIAIITNIIAIMIVLAWIMQQVNMFYDRLEVIAQEKGVSVVELTPQEIGDEIGKMWNDPENAATIQMCSTAVVMFLFIVFALEYFYAQTRSRAIKVTPHQFREIYDMSVRYAQILGLKKLPEIYLVQENGILNAFASNIIRRKYIQINIDLLEIAYREHEDLNAIGFVLAHEMAHIKLHHVSIWNRYTIMLSQLLPIIGPALSRSREYSCDRLAQVVSRSSGVDAIMALAMGKHLYKRTDVNDYVHSSYAARGLWVWIVNISSSHPLLPRRIRALLNPAIPGKIF